MLLVAFVLVAGLHPLVDFLEKKRIPRWLTTFLIFIVGLGFVGLFIYLISPMLAHELSALSSNVGYYLSQLPGKIKGQYIQNLINSLASQIGKASSTLFLTTKSVVSVVSSIVIVLVLCFYLLAQKEGLKRFIKIITPSKHSSYVLRVYSRIEKKMGRWILGQLASCLVVALLTIAGLALLGVPYALILGLLAGFMELIPFGVVFAFIPVGILGFAQSGLTGLLVIALYLVIQQIEGNIIIPQVMKKAVGLNPVLVILAILIGTKLAGLIGLVVAVPTAAVLSVFIDEFLERRK